MAAISTCDNPDKMLSGGMTILDATGCVVEANMALAQWLETSEAELRGKHFWTELWRRKPDWERSVNEMVQNPETFSALDLAAADAASPDGYRLEVARHREGCCVRIGRMGTPKRTNTAGADATAWEEILTKLGDRLAHDFNNLMTGLAMLGEGYHLQTDEGERYPEGMTIIKESAAKAKRTLQRILDLQHSKAGKQDFYDLNEVLRDAVELAQKLTSPRVKFELVAGPESLPVEVDRVAFRRMLLELTWRVANAMPRGGVLHFETSRYASLPAGEHRGVVPSVPGVCLTVKGESAGIAPALLADLFNEAISSDESAAVGSPGLRLFLQAHRAMVTVQSVADGGPSFCLWLADADFKAGP